MDAAEAGLAARGASRAILWVLESNNAARRFYERRGWTTDGASSPRPGGGTDLSMVRYNKTLSDT